MSRRSSVRAWPLPDRAAFLTWAATTAASDANESRRTRKSKKAVADGASTELFAQQRFCRHYLSHEGPHRGLVLYHGLGSGKSCSAIATSEALREVAPGRPVYVMLPASLRRNYMAEVRICGGRMFREAQAWRKLAPGPETQGHPWIAAVGPKTLAANGGSLWIPAGGEGDGEGAGGGGGTFTAFAKLSPSDREAVSRQVDDAIARTHKFVHYNGLTAKSAAALVDANGPNPFDDAVVVIDEVHNFVSNLGLHAEESKLVIGLYRRIYEARRCKVVLLSGTPLVNEPEEVAVLVNLAAGPVVVHEFPLGHRGLAPDAEARLAACPVVRDFSEEMRDGGMRQVLRVRLVPEGFVRAPGDSAGTFVTRASSSSNDANDANEEGQLRMATAALYGAAGASAGTSPPSKRVELELIPSDPLEFRSRFLKPRLNDGDAAVEELEAAAEDELARRMVGCISYFRGHDKSLYPALRSISMVQRPLSPRQFSEYTTQRVNERKREEAAKRFAAARGDKGGSVGVGVRPFSRAACTFVFPEGIVRPRRADVAAAEALAQEEENDTDDAVDLDDDPGQGQKIQRKTRRIDKAYQTALDAAIQALRDLPQGSLKCSTTTTTAGTKTRTRTKSSKGGVLGGHAPLPLLMDLSPKFDSIVGALAALSDKTKPEKDRGTAIVYSQFRRAEGVAILAVALEANGFVQLELSSTATPGERVAHLWRGGKPLLGPEITEAIRAAPRYFLYSNDDPDTAADMLRIFNDRLGELSSETLRKSLEALQPSNASAGSGMTGMTNLRGQMAAALLITRSGAEGISTKNVRQVHVIEPFWHANRVDQVIGRARRAHSHDALPAEDRTVDVFVYVATFTAEQAKAHGKDAGRTSDEHVHHVAQKKRALLLRLLHAMKRAAVDCAAYGPASVPEGGCVAAPPGAGPDRGLAPY
jgi:hypothetical protein